MDGLEQGITHSLYGANMRINIVRTNGQNGYAPGTYEAQVLNEEGLLAWYDGGWPDAESARAEGERFLALWKARQ